MTRPQPSVTFRLETKYLFLPDISSSKKGKLDDSWTGSYEVHGKILPITYAIDRADQRRKNAAVHVTAMKKWMPPIADTLFLSTSDSSETPELLNYAIEGGANFPPLADDLTNQEVQDLRTLWKKFPYATAPKLSGAKRAVQRILTGSATPVRMAPYRVTRIWEEPFCDQLKKLKEAKLITSSASAWAAPIFAVPKKASGQICLVNDYRRLNNNTDPDPYYQPNVDETLHRMAPAKYFNMFDMD